MRCSVSLTPVIDNLEIAGKLIGISRESVMLENIIFELNQPQ